MIRRTLVLATLALVGASTMQAQNASDPDKNVAGGGLPAGWSGRTDRPTTKIADAKFITVGKEDYHVTSGPAAIYWKTAQRVTGPFKASVTFSQVKAPTHPEAYGIFFLGNKLDAPEQNYAYFLVRGDGKVMVRHRAGNDLHPILDWTDNAGAKKQDASGKATNTLTVDATKPDSVRLYVNGSPAASLAVSHLGTTDGTVGLRVNHNLELHISDFTITPAPALSSAKDKGKNKVKNKAKG